MVQNFEEGESYGDVPEETFSETEQETTPGDEFSEPIPDLMTIPTPLAVKYKTVRRNKDYVPHFKGPHFFNVVVAIFSLLSIFLTPLIMIVPCVIGCYSEIGITSEALWSLLLSLFCLTIASIWWATIVGALAFVTWGVGLIFLVFLIPYGVVLGYYRLAGGSRKREMFRAYVKARSERTA